MAKAFIIHRALHQKSLNRNPKESDFNLRAVSPELNLTPSVKDLHLYTSHRGNIYFPCVVMGTRPGFIHFVATHMHRNTHTESKSACAHVSEHFVKMQTHAYCSPTHSDRLHNRVITGCQSECVHVWERVNQTEGCG